MRRKQCFPQFELSFSLKVKDQFMFQSSSFIFLADNRQKQDFAWEYIPNTQTYALTSRYLRCVIKSHGVSRGGIESNRFREHFQYLVRCPLVSIKLAINLPSLFRSFGLERSDGRSFMRLNISVTGQWLSPLRVNPYPNRDYLCLNNRIKWRTRNVYFIQNIFSAHNLAIQKKWYICASFSVNSLFVNHIAALFLRHHIIRISPIIWSWIGQCHTHHQ